MFAKKQKQEEQSDKKEEINIDDKVLIYVMPKSSGKTKAAAEAKKSSSKAGFIVLLIGGVVLIGMSVFLYLYVIKPSEKTSKAQPDSELETPEKPEEVDKKPKVVKDPQKEEPVDEPVKKTDPKDKKKITSKITPPKVLVDTDKDGLSDSEEELFNSDKNLKDTDGDGFSDLSEVMNGYNPSGPGKIVENVNVREFVNDKYQYSTLVPASWETNKIDSERGIIIKAPNGQTFQISVDLNLSKQTIVAWYKDQFDVDMVEPKNKFVMSGVDAIKKDDGLFVYINYAGNIYSISYNLGDENAKFYKNMFEIVLKNFKFTNID